MEQQTKKAFTLVELIVVITILAILGTIAFISLQGYSSSARDSKRISDIANIKKSLELFSVNTGKYPLPDNGAEYSFSGDLLWTQGIVGNNVTKNLSKNLQEKPLDPSLGSEYIYSVTNSQKQYEILANYETNDLVNNNLLNNTYALNYTAKISGTYNGIFIKSSNYIIPTPSIINALNIELDFKDNNAAIQSQVVTGLDNNIANGQIQASTGNLDLIFTYTGTINDDSSEAEKISVIETIQQAYSGTILSSNQEIDNILSKINNTDKKLLAEQIILNNLVFNAPSGGNIQIDYTSCKTILETGGSNGDGTYTIDPENNGTGFEVYCDMTNDGGGWILASDYQLGYNGISDPLLLKGYIDTNIDNLIVKDEIFTSSRVYKRFIKNTYLKGTDSIIGDVWFGEAKLNWSDSWEGDGWGNNKDLIQNFAYYHASSNSENCRLSTDWKCNIVSELHRTIKAEDGSVFISNAGTYYYGWNVYCGGLKILPDVVKASGCSQTHTFTTKGPEGSTQSSYYATMNNVQNIKKWIK